MELRTLRYFVTVVREGSITAAAKSLHVTQPTLSRQLAALEDELGHLLYQRNRKGIELTEQGVILRRYAESILALADKAEEEIALPTHSIAGKGAISPPARLQAMELVAEAMKRTSAAYPGITFELYSAPADLMDNFVRRLLRLPSGMRAAQPCGHAHLAPTPHRHVGSPCPPRQPPGSKGGRHARGPLTSRSSARAKA